ncbi:M36 family metallopeptidase [Aureisphaera galaxeae]|uniref:M36 family metallopeptidase n=1 Tax=Aureisphaera galaxeae TaxID=1538023 RepID=UPI00235066D8|nr:M36 family metallopeptidase [Aureisphaera galaxeae]MDC8003567.1 M36 family metallopeptidase [Aureisphaera galaxeae]
MYRPEKRILCTLLFGLFCCFIQAQNAQKLISQFFDESNSKKSAQEYTLLRDVVSKTSNVRHIYFQQTLGGVPILSTQSSLHFSNDGKLIASTDNFLKNIASATPKALKKVLPPENALEGIVRQMGYVSLESFSEIEKTTETPYEIHYLYPSLFEREVSLYLNYVEWEDQIVPIWKAQFFERDYVHYWEAWYHAIEGKLLKVEDLATHCDFESAEPHFNYNDNLYNKTNEAISESDTAVSCENCYEVFMLPTESPLHGNRSVIEEPHRIEASPYGWHDTDGMDGPESLATNGNNVFAFEAGDHYGYQASGGNSLDFSGFPFSMEYSEENQFEDAAITNVFYTSNIAHDIFHTYGFDEGSGNFQNYNYSEQGEDEDGLLAHVQSETRPCNAFMVTPRDGRSPTLVMNTCNNRDGAYDNLVIIHEYAHGVSSRMTLGDGNLNYKESPSEGWSDWFGLMLTMTEADTALTHRTIATYLRGQSPDGPGIRRYPYTTDMAVNPLVFDDLEEGMSIHTVGTIWATMLWELTWVLIDTFGFDPDIYNFTGDLNQDAGNVIAMAIVVEGLRYATSLSGLVQARDGILVAAQTIYGPGIQCLIWEAFTKRGLGLHANSGSSIVLGDEVSSYDFEVLEPQFRLDLEGICNTTEEMGFITGGFPAGGVYSGPGVRDNGNGVHFSLDPALAGVGIHEISYSLAESPCFPASQMTVLVEISADTEPPVIRCIEDNTQAYATRLGFELPDYTQEVFMKDACSNFNFARTAQTPAPGTWLTQGTVDINLEVEDLAGNVSNCSFTLTLVENFDLDGKSFKIVPVPATSEIVLENPFELLVERYYIWDLLGKQIVSAGVNAENPSIPISIESLQAGMYFLSVDFRGKQETFRIIKN